MNEVARCSKAGGIACFIALPAALWNKGGWIQNRANTLALWCMFAQVFPLFQDASRFTTVTSVYGKGAFPRQWVASCRQLQIRQHRALSPFCPLQ